MTTILTDLNQIGIKDKIVVDSYHNPPDINTRQEQSKLGKF